MMIISKWRDCYDFYSDIYGVDNKIVLDRRESTGKVYMYEPLSDQTVYLALCDTIYEGYVKDGKYFWGINVVELLDEKGKQEFYKSKDKSFTNIPNVAVNRYWRSNTIKTIPYADPNKVNTKQNCPIIFSTHKNFNNAIRYPKLEDLNITTVIHPKDIYLKLIEWMAPKENHEDTRTDREKVVSNGFSLKTSFRNM